MRSAEGVDTKLPWTSRGTPLSREGEAWRAALVFTYLFLVIGSYVILKAVRDSLYLDAFGAVKLPYVIIGIAILVGIFVDGYIRLSRHVRVPLLTSLTLSFLVANLVAFWGIGRTGQPWLYPVLYIWVGCFGVIAPVQVWTMVNEVFATREAKRLVSLIGAGGIAGAVAGGAAAGALADRIGTIQLLLVVAALLSICILLVRALAKYQRTDRALARLPRPENLRQAVATIFGSRHLRVVGALIWLSAVCTTVVDYQFKAAASGAGFDRDALTAFFGSVYSGMALACLGVQLLLVRGLLRRFGLGTVVLVLPLALLAGTTVLIAFGTLWAATLLKSGDGAFKHSVDRSSKELAYLPIPADIKVSVKSTIDMVLDRLGDGSGGVLLMVLATWLGLGVRTIATFNLPLLTAWLLVALALRRSYLNELERAIGGRTRRVTLEDDTLDDADARAALLAALRSGDDTAVLAALELVTDPRGEVAPELHRLAREGSPEVRAKVIGVLLQAGEEGLPVELTRGLEGEDQDLLVRALDLVLAETPEDLQRRAGELVGRAAPETRGALLALMVRRLGPEFEPMAQRMLDSLAAAGAPASTRRAAAAAIGLLPARSTVGGHLERLLGDEDPGVRAEAAVSAGRLRRVELAPRLVALLGRPRTRRAARIALRRLGAEAAPALRVGVLAEDTPWEVRRRLPGLLAELAADGELVEVARALDGAGPDVRRAALESLSFRRHVFPGDPPYAEVIERAAPGLAREVATCHRLLQNWHDLHAVERADPEVGFLAVEVRERAMQSMHRVFHWLEAGGASPMVLRAVREGLEHGDRARRENAAELLDGMLDRVLRPSILALVERMPWTATERPSTTARAVDRTLADALSRLAEAADPWLAAWAVHLARRRGLTEVISRAREAAAGPLLLEELERAGEVAPRTPEGNSMGRSTLLDKVMALKNVELFHAVPAEELVPMARVAREESFDAGQALFSEGDPAGALYILLSGRVGLRRGEVAAGVMPAGSALGMWTLFENEPRRVSAVALEPTRALVVEREDFFDVLGEHVSIVRSVLGDLVQRLRNVAI